MALEDYEDQASVSSTATMAELRKALNKAIETINTLVHEWTGSDENV